MVWNDLYYRVITSKKPFHHPQKMPRALILYIVLLNAGQIAGNGYAFLFDYTWGQIVLLSYLAGLAVYG